MAAPKRNNLLLNDSQPQVAEVQKLHDAREQLSNEQMAMLEKRESI